MPHIVIRLLLLLVVSGLIGYTGMSLVEPLSGGARVLGVLSVAIPYAALLGLIFVVWRRRRGTAGVVGRLVQRVAFFGMGYMSFISVLVVARDVVSLFWPALRTGESSLAVMGLSLGFLAVGYVGARHSLKVKRVEVPIRGLGRALEGFRIVQLTDVHVSSGLRRDYVEKIVTMVNACEADVVVLTGDIGDGAVVEHHADTEPFTRLQAKHAKYFVTGNHEYYWDGPGWTAHFGQLGIKPLHNSHEVLNTGGAQIVFAGVPDIAAAMFGIEKQDLEGALAGAPGAHVPRVLLAHQARIAPEAVKHGFQLLISGHTHGGQFFPWTLVVSLTDRFAHGLRRLDDLWVYVSRGTGYWGPAVRLGSPSEVTLLVLKDGGA